MGVRYRPGAGAATAGGAGVPRVLLERLSDECPQGTRRAPRVPADGPRSTDRRWPGATCLGKRRGATTERPSNARRATPPSAAMVGSVAGRPIADVGHAADGPVGSCRVPKVGRPGAYASSMSERVACRLAGTRLERGLALVLVVVVLLTGSLGSVVTPPASAAGPLLTTEVTGSPFRGGGPRRWVALRWRSRVPRGSRSGAQLQRGPAPDPGER